MRNAHPIPWETRENATFIQVPLEPSDMRREILEGLTLEQKRVHPKYFYDQQGAQLFEEITRQPEYYLTRSEMGILRQSAGEMLDFMGTRTALVELGSGSSEKVRILLEQRRSITAYVPVDISKVHLQMAAYAVAEQYPHLQVTAVCADYTKSFPLPDTAAYDRRVFFFPGSTIGNMEPSEAQIFLAHLASLSKPADGMLVGVDLRKETERLNRAYNDDGGVTAAFNLNLLQRINRELDADFVLDQFAHEAFFHEKMGRVEMHLRSLKKQTVTVAGEVITLGDGERIHTENSYKYEIPAFQSLARKAGFVPRACWQDDRGDFSVHYLEVE